MNGLTARLAAALLVLVGIPAMLGGCIGEPGDEESDPAAPSAVASASGTTAATSTVDSSRTSPTAVRELARSRAVSGTVTNGTPIADVSSPTASDPEPNPWDTSTNNPHANAAH